MVLSNYEIHAIQIQTSRSSQNPILSTFFEQNIILLILQLETDHFSSPFISEMCYLKQRHSTVLQDLQKLHSTRKRSSRILQFYTTRGPYPENYSTFRRQRDLRLIPHTEGKEIFIPIILQYTSMYATRPSKGITGHSRHSSIPRQFYMHPGLPGFHPITASSTRMHILHIGWFPHKTPPSTS